MFLNGLARNVLKLGPSITLDKGDYMTDNGVRQVKQQGTKETPMYCADCKRYGVKVQTIRVGTRETIEVCVDTADCKAARPAKRA